MTIDLVLGYSIRLESLDFFLLVINRPCLYAEH